MQKKGKHYEISTVYDYGLSLFTNFGMADELGGTMKIEKKILEIMKEIVSLDKTKKNEKQGYNYTPGEDVLHEVRQAMIKHGLVLTSECTNIQTEPFETTGGSKMLLTTACMVYRLHDVDSEEKREYKYHGIGQDSGDKGLYKAYTAGLKYFLRDTFLIPFGLNPEDEKQETTKETTKEPKEFKKLGNSLTDKQHALLRLYFNNAGFKTNLWSMLNTYFEVDHTSKIDIEKFDKFMLDVAETIQREPKDKITENEFLLIGDMIMKKVGGAE